VLRDKNVERKAREALSFLTGIIYLMAPLSMFIKDKNKSNLVKILLAVLSFMAVLVVYGAVAQNKLRDTGIKQDVATVIIKDKIIFAEVADTTEERAQGLSGKESLKENEGMIFVFKNPTVPGFWMKDMLFPIDIVWINESGKVVSVTKNAGPESYPLVFYPEGSIRYVLEVPAGFSEKNNLKKGDMVSIKL